MNRSDSTRITKAAITAAIALAVSTALSGCGGSSEAAAGIVAEGSTCTADSVTAVSAVDLAGTAAPDGIAIVVANTANSGLPSLSASTSALVSDYLATGKTPSVWSATATPQQLEVPFQRISETNSERKNETRVKNNLNRLSTAVATGPAGPGQSLYEGIGMARDQLVSDQSEHPWIIVIGSGLDDTGAMATTEGLLNQSADVVAEKIASSGGSDLAGVTVVLQSLGYTAGSQETPSAAQRELIVDLWKTTLTKLGADVRVDPRPAPSCAVATDQPMHPTELPKPIVECFDETISYRLPGRLLFDGDSSALRADVPSLMTEAVELLTSTPDAHATVKGHTASSGRYSADELVALSEARATSVARVLLDGGIAADRITTVGVGDTEPLAEDLNPDGTQNELAEAERRVQVLITGTTACD